MQTVTRQPTGHARDRAIAEIAGRQHGRIGLWQLEDLGLSRSAISGRVRSGRLHRVRRGVYAVGHLVETADSFRMGGVLACGPGAVLSHRSAAEHHGLRCGTRARVEVTVPRQRGRRLEGIEAHRSRTLLPAEVTIVRGILCTTVARTLLDLADVVDRRTLERSIEEAERLRIFNLDEVRAVLERSKGRRGASLLRAILADYEEPPFTQRELERRFLELCQAGGIDKPQTQAPIELAGGETIVVDFLWPDAKLIGETDGRESHGTRQAFERDRRRDRRLMMLGYRVVRFTWLDVELHPEDVVRTISALR